MLYGDGCAGGVLVLYGVWIVDGANGKIHEQETEEEATEWLRFEKNNFTKTWGLFVFCFVLFVFVLLWHTGLYLEVLSCTSNPKGGFRSLEYFLTDCVFTEHTIKKKNTGREGWSLLSDKFNHCRHW